MKGKKVLKIIGIILLVLIALVLIHTIRNFIIIRVLQKNFEQYSSSTNYHITSHSVQEDVTTDIDYYKKGGKEAMILNRTKDGKTIKISIYNNGKRIDTFYDADDSKIAKLNSSDEIDLPMSNGLEYESNFQTFMVSMFTLIKKEEVNQKECYLITALLSHEKTYYEKDTGLIIKGILNGQIVEKNYEFDNVEDSSFLEPNISEYTLKE